MVHDGQYIQVVINSSDEVFVIDKSTRVELRIGTRYGGLVATSQNSKLGPTSVNGLDAFYARTIS